MKAPPKVLPPAAIIVWVQWLVAHPYFRAEWQATLDNLSKAEVWHQLGKNHPVITRAQLIEELSRGCWLGEEGSWIGEILDYEKWSDRDVALQVTFLNSLYLAIMGMETITVAKKKELVGSYRKREKQLRNAAAWFMRLNLEEGEEHGQAVERAAVWCKKEADEMIDKDPNQTFYDNTLVVARDRGQPRVRAYCMKLAKITRLLYGNVFDNTVIAITRTALGVEVPIENLRYWCKKDVSKWP
jgi:hypothetical protein